MSLFTFYREDSPEPPSLALAVVKEDGREPDVDKYANIDFHRYPSGCNLATFFGTPRLRPTTGDPDGLDFSDELSIDGLDMEKDAVAYDLEYKGMRGQMSTMNSHHRVSEAPTLCPSVGPMSIPVELWEIIFSLVCPGADDESYPKLNDLLSCALTCRVRGPNFEGREVWIGERSD